MLGSPAADVGLRPVPRPASWLEMARVHPAPQPGDPPVACSVGSPAFEKEMEESTAFLEGKELDDEVRELQKQLDLLTQLRSETAALRGAHEGPSDPNDPTDKLLAYGLRALLRKTVQVMGPERAPGVLVSFSGLTFKAQVFEGSNVVATNGNELLKLLMPWRHRRTVEKYVLRDVTGSFRPGRTTLVLGPPRSGKSALMKVLAGRMRESRHAQLQGTTEYGGQRLQDPAVRTRRGSLKLYKLVGYIPQTDLHIPTLTCRETIRFAHACTALPTEELIQQEGLGEQASRELLLILRDLLGELVMAILGIRHVGDTLVGDEQLRGVSGGQRKRLTTGEIVVTGTPVLLADEISTGLDSATTFDICSALRACAHDLNSTIVVSLLQPTPETYGTFDEVLVMAAGQIAFQGPRDQVLPYFQSLGFLCPQGKDAAEFLQEVVLPEGMAKYRGDVEAGAAWYTIHDPEDFGLAWRHSDLFRHRLEEDVPLYQKSKDSLNALPAKGYTWHVLTTEYTNPLSHSMWLCLRRQVLLTVRNKQVTLSNAAQVVVIGLILGSLYYQLPYDNYSSVYAVLFFSMLSIALSGFASIPATIRDRNVMYRQTEAHFFSPMPYSIAASVLDVPMAVLEVALFSTIVYWMVGLSPTVGDFFLFFITIVLVKLAMGAVIRLGTVLSPNAEAANSLCSVVLLAFVLHAGYFAAQEDIKPWWIWSYWINPLQYGMTSLAQIQFQAGKYMQLIDPADPAQGTWGQYFLAVKKMPQDGRRLWLGLIFNAGFFLAMTVAVGLALRFVRFSDEHPPQPPLPTKPPILEAAHDVPFVPCTMAWQDVSYDVDVPGQSGPSAKLGLRLLSHVSGYAKPGTLTALMGSSGAGKTTLLDVLASRKNTGRVTGQILLNGQVVDPLTFSRCSGYVEQMDIHSPTATVVEAVRFSALLRLPRELPAAEKEAFVWKVLQQLNLQPIAHCPVGDRHTGLSVEQVKRLTIAVEMAANPSVLFLDEPTSGLDSLAADVVMDALKAVAGTGRTLICTIHQPSAHLFGMFGHLLLLVQGGKTVFFGETGEDSRDLVAYFSSIDRVPQHDGQQNPATWMLTVIATAGVDFPAEYEKTGLCRQNTAELQRAIQPTGEQLTGGYPYQATYRTQFQLLAQKWLRLHWRFPDYNLARTFTSAFVALIMGSAFFRVDAHGQQGVFTQAGLQYIAMLILSLVFADTVQGLVAVERAVFYRERAAHMYHPLLLDVVAGLCEVPYVAVNSLVFVSIFYWMVGMNSDVGVFFTWFLIYFLYVLFYTYFGFLVGFLMPTPQLAAAMVSVFASISSQLSGFMQPRPDIPWWWRWLHYALPETYALQAAFSSQFYCAAADQDPAHPGACATFQLEEPSGAVVVTPVWGFVRDHFALLYGSRWLHVGLLVMFLAVVRLGTGLTLAYVNHAKR